MSADVFSLLPKEFNGKNGKVITIEEVKESQFFGIYFSAHWCPPCRGFTPVLANFYKKVNANSKKVEIIFASSDRSKEQFNEYFSSMPWISIPFESDSRGKLRDAFGISGIPTLLVFDKNGKLIDTEGRSTVIEEKENAIAEWEKPNPKKRRKTFRPDLIIIFVVILFQILYTYFKK